MEPNCYIFMYSSQKARNFATRNSFSRLIKVFQMTILRKIITTTCIPKMLLLLCFLFSVDNSFSQEYNFKTFSTEQGLVQIKVNDILQDRKGYIWIATDGGLSRFDGKNFTNYTAKDGLVNNKCTKLFVDSKDRIWIGHLYGVSLMVGKHIQAFSSSSGTNLREVQSFAENREGIWIGGVKGLVKFNDKTSTPIPIPPKYGNQVTSLAIDSFDRLWIGLNATGGLLIYQKGQLRQVTSKDLSIPVSSLSPIQCLLPVAGSMWIFTSDGIYKHEKDELIQVKYSGTYLGAEKAVLKKDGSVWMATPNGLAQLKSNILQYFTQSNGLPYSAVSTVMTDREENLWIGGGQGISLLSSLAFSQFSSDQQNQPFSPSCIAQGPDGKIWFNSEPNGLFFLENNSIQKVKQPSQLNEHFFSCIQPDLMGNIWLGTADFNGIFKLNPKHQLHQYTTDDGLPDNVIQCLRVGLEGQLYAGTSKGLAVFDGKRWIKLGNPDGIIAFDIKTLHVSTDGKLWVGTSDGKVYSYFQTQWKELPGMEGIVYGSITDISSSSNTLYITADGEGLIVYQDRPILINKETGLSTSEIRFVEVSLSGRELWCGTPKGLLHLLLDNRGNIQSQKLWTQADGFFGGECLPGAALTTSDKMIWCCTPKGVTAFNPQSPIVSTIPPLVDLVGIDLFNKEPDWKDYSKLISSATGFGIDPAFPATDNYLSFRFTALHFRSPLTIQYQWKLEGYEKDWNRPSKFDEVNYPELPPGSYVFKVRAISDSGLISQPAAFSFTITPPFYKTIWFLSLSVLTLLIAGISIVKYREQILVKEKEVLEHAVKQRTKELEEQKYLVEQKNADIMENINYAKNIQLAILPGKEELSRAFSEHFVLFKPQDIVSGDFFWYFHQEDLVWAAAVDCTGHGIPGAFMSMMGNDLLNQAIIEKGISDPALVLANMNRSIRLVFREENQVIETQQGMDISLICLNLHTGLMKFAGAMRPLIVARDNEMVEWEGDKASIGRYTTENFSFTTHSISLKKGDSLFLFTDGFCDQFGGTKGKKFLSSRFKQILSSHNKEPMENLGNILCKELENWQGSLNQVDDILVMGFRY